MSLNDESNTLTVDYWVLLRRIAHVLALPDDLSAWHDHQRSRALQVLEDGLRQYYSPPNVDHFGPHSWSFMYPTTEIQTVSSQRWYQLPDGFDHLQGAGLLTYTSGEDYYVPIEVVSESYLRKQETMSDYNSYPRFAAVRPKGGDGVSDQRFELGLHPTPDSEYRLAFQYHAAPYMLSEERPIPLGGPGHAQGILKSCLAAAEEHEYDQQGPRYEAFMRQLAADIDMDARKAPKTVGKNNNIPWLGHRHRRSEYLYHRSVTYGGSEYNS